MKLLKKETEFEIREQEYNTIAREIALEGKIDTIVKMTEKYLNNLSNRDFLKFDEKYVKLIFYSIAMNLKMFNIKSEMEVHRKYPDILIEPKEKEKGYSTVIIEFKYLKKKEENKLEAKQKEAKEQINEYVNFEEIRKIENLHKYIVVAVNDKIYVEKI